MVRKLRHLIASKIKGQLRVMSGMRSEGGGGGGNLGNKKADPDAEAEEISQRQLRKDMGRVRAGDRWAMKQGREVQGDSLSVYYFIKKKKSSGLVHWVALKKLKNKQTEML